MGTGIVSILLLRLPYTAPGVQYVAYVFFAVNVALFAAFSAVSALRYALYPQIWRAMIAHPGQSLFLGCFPMAFASRLPPPPAGLSPLSRPPTDARPRQPSST